jgi:hypothetical protein
MSLEGRTPRSGLRSLGVVAAVRRAREAGGVEEAAAAAHAIVVAPSIQVPAPLPQIPVHVMEPPRIRAQRIHRRVHHVAILQLRPVPDVSAKSPPPSPPSDPLDSPPPRNDPRSAPVHHGQDVPARHPYSHSASVGNSSPQCVSSFRHISQDTCSTGLQSVSLPWIGKLSPALYSARSCLLAQTREPCPLPLRQLVPRQEKRRSSTLRGGDSADIACGS